MILYSQLIKQSYTMKTYLAWMLIIGILSVICHSNAKKSRSLRSFFNEIRIYEDLRNIIHRLIVAKMKSDKKEKVADVFNIIYDDIKPIHRFGKFRNCKNMEKLSMKMIRRITRSHGG